MNYSGLTAKEVAESRAKYGENVLTPPRKEPLWRQLLAKFAEPLIVILLVALLMSVGIAFYEYIVTGAGASVFLEPAGILLAVLLATVVGFVFEVNANRKFDMLNQVNDNIEVKVIREGNVSVVLRREVVVGDIVLIETGEEIAADGELLECRTLQMDESTLTGEPLARKTTVETDFDTEATYQSNTVLKGTLVVEGNAVMRVSAVGDMTEYGKVYTGAQIDNKVETPLNRQLKRLAHQLAMVAYTIAAVLIVARVCSYFATVEEFEALAFGEYILRTLMIAVTLIVVAVPEGLPMSVTLSLALSMKRMLATNNLVRKMHACETIGAATVICTDKTGTLTENRMRVSELCTYNSEESLVEEAIAVNSTAFLDFSNGKVQPLGNPTEGALLLWLNDKGTNYLTLRESAEIVEQLGFTTETKYMATVVHSGQQNNNSGKKTKILYVKGAPEIVMSMCSEFPIQKSEIESRLLSWQSRAMRTLALAYCPVAEDEIVIADGRVFGTGLRLLGIVAISDPVRSDVGEAVHSCMTAGIDIKMVTGDTPATAREIGRQIGLWSDANTTDDLLTGVEFAAMSDDELLGRIGNLKIMSRARPMDKQRLVKLLQSQGAVVAVTGDGTNDAPALNAAQVGLSMGDGTSVAKQASDITILDNSFASITRAVMWGRSLYKNIRRFILFQMTINVVACLIVLLGVFIGTESPLTVTQMLWVNIIMDTFAAMAMASLPPSDEVMLDKPRRVGSDIVNKKMASIIFSVGALFVLFLFGLLQYFRNADIASLTEFSIVDFGCSYFNFGSGGTVSAYELSLFFTTFVMMQFWNMFNAKAFMTRRSALANIRQSRGFVAVMGLILLGQIAIVSFGGEMFGVVPLKVWDWIIIVVATSLVLWLAELVRVLTRKRS